MATGLTELKSALVSRAGAFSSAFRPLFLFFLLLLTQEAGGATLKELINTSRQLIGDTPYYTGLPKLSDKRITAYLNEAQNWAASNSQAFVRRTTFTLVGGATEYFLPTSFHTSKRVTLDNIILPEQTLDALDGDGVNWFGQSGKPQYYYIRTTTFSTIGFNPAPTVDSTGTIILDYITQIDPLVGMDDSPFNRLPDMLPFHDALPKFVAYRFYLSIGQVQLADIFAKEYLNDVSKMKEVMGYKPNYRPGVSAVPR